MYIYFCFSLESREIDTAFDGCFHKLRKQGRDVVGKSYMKNSLVPD